MTSIRNAMGLLATSLLCLTSCVDPQQQAIADAQRCSAYGFVQGTDAFSNCMFRTAQQRDMQEREDARQTRASLSAERQQRDAIQAANQLLSARRDGDKRYKLCSAASAGSQLDVKTHTWSGENCRSR